MNDDGRRTVEAAVSGAGRAFQVFEGGKGKEPPHDPGERDECPVVALGHLDGMFHFLDVCGQKRALSAAQLQRRGDIVSLFLGDEAWLRRTFPKRVKVKQADDSEQEVTVDFRINSAATWLQRECREAGLFGDHVVLRKPGIWPAENGTPAVHCGDAVLIDGKWLPAGTRTGNSVWAAAPAMPRPDTPCEAAVGEQLASDLRSLWNFRRAGGEIVTLGILGNAYFGGATQWRPAGFITGGAGCGKTMLLNALRACCPLHHYTTDTTKAGLETALDGRAMPSFLEEATATKDARGARVLIDMVLSATVGEGTKGHRRGEHGESRVIQLVGSIIMASDHPPEMKATHLGRFAIVELGAPADGADHRDAHQALIARMKRAAGGLWGRALSSWDRYNECLPLFRASLRDARCAPREMDQLGALLAGWWILTREGLPDARGVMEGVSALTEFVRPAEDVREDDGPRRMLRHLLSTLVQMDRSTARAPIGTLIEIALFDNGLDYHAGEEGRTSREHAHRVLTDYGIRVIRASDPVQDKRQRLIPRAGLGNGVWFGRSPELAKIFAGTDFEGNKWEVELRRLESARQSEGNVRIGGTAGRAVWVSAEELGFEADQADARQP